MTLSESASSSTQAINHHEYSDCLSSVYSSTSLTNPNSLPTAPMLENDHWEHSRLRHSWKHFPALSLNHDPINNHFINNDVWSSFSKHLLDSFDNKTVENPSIPFNQDHFLKVASNLEGGTRDHAALVAYPGLESFKLLEKLGEGAFSQVYHAFDLEHKKDVAIKVIDKAHMSPYQRLAVQNEISIHSKLKHPNIISLNRHFETPSNYFLVMEWMPGGEIFQKIVELTFFSEDLSRHVIIQVAKGIHYLHHVVGVVHRYVKFPDTIT
ncbi:hypothetical protein HMI54_009982 [Coelomomyces lativittatus]|nr:hypothetical protein HMI54_009982 [Coelomomyces lativittatus]